MIRARTKELRGRPALAAGLGVVLAVTAVRAQDAAVPFLNPLRALEKSKLKGFVEQPLFDPSRHLAPAPTAVPLQVYSAPQPLIVPPAAPPSLHLLGIIQGREDIAVVRRDGDAKTLMLSNGDRIDSWTVKVLPTLGVQLRDGDRVFTYALFGMSNASIGVSQEAESKASAR